MSTVVKPQQPANPAPRPVVVPKAPSKSSSAAPQREQFFLFDKENYMWMIGGVALIFIGFMLMSGGKSPNPHEFNYSEIYSVRRITIAPIVVLLGFIVEVYAIMKKPKEQEQNPAQ